MSEVEKVNDSSQEIGYVLNIWGELGTGVQTRTGKEKQKVQQKEGHRYENKKQKRTTKMMRKRRLNEEEKNEVEETSNEE